MEHYEITCRWCEVTVTAVTERTAEDLHDTHQRMCPDPDLVVVGGDV